MSRLKDQDKDALSYVYDKYGAALYGIANRIVNDVEVSREVVQDVFLKIWNKIDSYDPSKGKFFTWMLNIAITFQISLGLKCPVRP